jgi:hypothetical protein
MAVQRFAWSESKGYTIKIFADRDDISFNPFEFVTAEWKVTYDAQDAYVPGIISSRFEVTAQFTGAPFSTALEQVMQDGVGVYYMELWQGLSKEWAGIINPSASTIEIINGTRFITMLATDGFYKLELNSAMYSFVGPKRIIVQIADMMQRVNLHKLFTGFAVSQTNHHRAELGPPYSYDVLYNTACYHGGVYYPIEDYPNYRSYREVLNDFCVTYGLRMYQEKGMLVFQDLTRIDQSQYNIYDVNGAYVTSINAPTTVTRQPMDGGTKMYLPPLRSYKIHHQYVNEIIGVQTVYTRVEHTEKTATGNIRKPGVQVGVFLGDGTSHIDLYNTAIDVTLGYVGPYNSNFSIDVKLYIVYGDYFWDGTDWIKGVSTPYILKSSGSINSPTSGTVTRTVSLNNYHTDPPPAEGLAPLWFYVEVEQVSGDALILVDTVAKWDFRRHGTLDGVTEYFADNTARLLGEDVTLSTRLGDRYNPNEPDGISAGLLQAVQNPMGFNIIEWIEDPESDDDDTYNSLLYIVVSRLAQQRGQPQEYYELDVHGTARMTHFLEWGGSYYIPINLEWTWDRSRITYVRFFSFELLSSSLITKSPDFGIFNE